MLLRWKFGRGLDGIAIAKFHNLKLEEYDLSWKKGRLKQKISRQQQAGRWFSNQKKNPNVIRTLDYELNPGRINFVDAHWIDEEGPTNRREKDLLDNLIIYMRFPKRNLLMASTQVQDFNIG